MQDPHTIHDWYCSLALEMSYSQRFPLCYKLSLLELFQLYYTGTERMQKDSLSEIMLFSHYDD
jgi:hypothetical protein